jgi:hypothetical protein
MNWDDEDNSWMDALVSEVPAAPAKSTTSAGKGLWKNPPEFGQKVSARRRGQTGITGLYERSDHTRALNRQASSVPVQTPDGVFASKGEAAEFYGIHRNNFSIRMKRFPDLYFALVDCVKRGNATRGPERRGLWKMSPEVCAKISAALKGKAQSAEHSAKISAGKKGRTAWNKGISMMSAEARAKIGAAQKGKQVWIIFVFSYIRSVISILFHCVFVFFHFFR